MSALFAYPMNSLLLHKLQGLQYCLALFTCYREGVYSVESYMQYKPHFYPGTDLCFIYKANVLVAFIFYKQMYECSLYYTNWLSILWKWALSAHELASQMSSAIQTLQFTSCQQYISPCSPKYPGKTRGFSSCWKTWLWNTLQYFREWRINQNGRECI